MSVVKVHWQASCLARRGVRIYEGKDGHDFFSFLLGARREQCQYEVIEALLTLRGVSSAVSF